MIKGLVTAVERDRRVRRGGVEDDGRGSGERRGGALTKVGQRSGGSLTLAGDGAERHTTTESCALLSPHGERGVSHPREMSFI